MINNEFEIGLLKVLGEIRDELKRLQPPAPQLVPYPVYPSPWYPPIITESITPINTPGEYPPTITYTNENKQNPHKET